MPLWTSDQSSSVTAVTKSGTSSENLKWIPPNMIRFSGKKLDKLDKNDLSNIMKFLNIGINSDVYFQS